MSVRSVLTPAEMRVASRGLLVDSTGPSPVSFYPRKIKLAAKFVREESRTLEVRSRERRIDGG